jgi:hypothetical protein
VPEGAIVAARVTIIDNLGDLSEGVTVFVETEFDPSHNGSRDQSPVNAIRHLEGI